MEKRESKKNDLQIPAYWDFVIADGKLWYSSSLFNGLFCQELEEGKPEFMGFFPGEDFYQLDLYRRVILVDKELVFIPWFAKNVNIYNLNTSEFMTIEIPDTDIMGKYASVELIEDKVYMFPALAKKVLCLNVSKREISELEEFDKFLKGMLNRTGQVFYWFGTVRIEEWIHLLVKDTNQLLSYNWKKRRIFLQDLAEKTVVLEGMVAYKKMLFIRIKNQNRLLCLNTITGDKTTNDLNDLPMPKEQSAMMIYERKLYFYFPITNLLVEMLMNPIRLKKVIPLGESNVSFLVKQIEKNLFFLPYYGNELYQYDIKKESCTYMSLECFKITVKWMRNYIENYRMLISEGELIGIKGYIDAIAMMKKEQEKKENANLAERIWIAL